ncbi:MAG: sulfotransferase [Flavobacteriia bacterium]|nr:sulfotransferase [Flavobacteriia bacterium]
MRSPIVLGAIENAGNSDLARILELWGVNMGTVLNDRHEDVLFNHLFNRPRYIHAVSDKRLQIRLRAYGRIRMEGQLNRKLHAEWVREGHEPVGGIRPMEAEELIQTTMSEPIGDVDWGWNVPSSHVIVPHIKTVYSNVKYIHLIRHGYTSAMSDTTQLEDWGEHYGIPKKKINREVVWAKFHYWRVANRGAQLVGERLLGENFMMLKQEDLVNEPVSTLEKVASFADLRVTSDQLEEAVKLIKKPSDFDAWKSVSADEVADDGTSLELFGYKSEDDSESSSETE